MNDELISRNALISEFEWLKSVVNESSKGEVEETIQRIRNAPAVEENPVRHGQWLYGDTDNVFLIEIYCPWCGKPALYPQDEDRPLETPFCPHCGAVMDTTKPDPSWPFYDMSLKEKMKMNR